METETFIILADRNIDLQNEKLFVASRIILVIATFILVFGLVDRLTLKTVIILLGSVISLVVGLVIICDSWIQKRARIRELKKMIKNKNLDLLVEAEKYVKAILKIGHNNGYEVSLLIKAQEIGTMKLAIKELQENKKGNP